MTRIWQCGWETGDVNQKGSITNNGFSNNGTVSAVSASPTARSGTYCLRCGVVAPSASNVSGRVMISDTFSSKTELYIAFGLYRHNTGEVGTVPLSGMLVLYDTAGNLNLFITCETDGTIRAYYATAGGGNPSNSQVTLIGASTQTVALDTWTLIEVHAVAATGATGTCEIKVNGIVGLTNTATRTAQTNANFGQFACGLYHIQGGNVISYYYGIDDLRINDTTGPPNNSWCGDEKIIMLTPNAAGDSSQFSRGGADSGNNYSQVDDIPPNGTTDYVYDTTTGHLDLYNLTTTAVQGISAVDVVMQAFNSDGAGGSLNLVTKTAAGQSDGSAQSITGAPAYYHRLLETDPADSGAWTQAKIDALQVGPKVAS